MRNYFQAAVSRDLSFRRQQLKALKNSIVRHEESIYDALRKDLGKGKEEAYATEIGLTLIEINLALQSLRKWSRPVRVSTNILNLPSSSRIYYEPKGVVLVIAPWNYPFQLSMIPLLGAIAAGNSVVLKPSELAPATATLLEKIIGEAFPKEYVRVVPGEGSIVVPALMKEFRFDHIFYTGSTSVGKSIYKMAASDLIPVTLELGGKSPSVVEADANLEIAARRIALGKFINAGQTCVAPDYVLVQESVKTAFVEKLKQVITRFYGEQPSESDSYGRIINAKQFDRLISLLNKGETLIGGEHDHSKLFIAPTVLTGIGPEDEIMREEIFGPILPVLGFVDRKDALSIIDLNPNPLAFYIFTEDAKRGKEWIDSLAFGGGCINNAAYQFTNPHFSFGGIGKSGIGGYHGKSSFLCFSNAKSILKTPSWFDPDFRYPPFKGRLKLFKWLIK
jgi:aldehyde dehydrogenase (NAD+)